MIQYRQSRSCRKMNKLYADFLLVASVVCLFFVPDAFSASSVKRLGGGGTYVGTNQAMSAKNAENSTSTGSRVSSVRANRSGGVGKGASVKSGKATSASNTSRLSVGKYLHNTGLNTGRIKSVSTANSVNPMEVNDLTARVDNLETQMQNKLDTDVFEDYKVYVDNNYATKAEAENTTGMNLDTVSDWEKYKPIW